MVPAVKRLFAITTLGGTRLAQRSNQCVPFAASCAQNARREPDWRAVFPNIAMGHAMWQITTSNGWSVSRRRKLARADQIVQGLRVRTSPS
jgi:hypothetical protein